jgi:hypothetical protein
MKRHRTDMLALLFGLAFAAVGATFLVREVVDTEIDAAWVSAVAFVLLGVVALATTLLRPRGDDAGDAEAAPAFAEPAVSSAPPSETDTDDQRT